MKRTLEAGSKKNALEELPRNSQGKKLLRRTLENEENF